MNGNHMSPCAGQRITLQTSWLDSDAELGSSACVANGSIRVDSPGCHMFVKTYRKHERISAQKLFDIEKLIKPG